MVLPPSSDWPTDCDTLSDDCVPSEFEESASCSSGDGSCVVVFEPEPKTSFTCGVTVTVVMLYCPIVLPLFCVIVATDPMVPGSLMPLDGIVPVTVPLPV